MENKICSNAVQSVIKEHDENPQRFWRTLAPGDDTISIRCGGKGLNQ